MRILSPNDGKSATSGARSRSGRELRTNT